MPELGLAGAVRGKVKRTTISAPRAAKPRDLVPPSRGTGWSVAAEARFGKHSCSHPRLVGLLVKLNEDRRYHVARVERSPRAGITNCEPWRSLRTQLLRDEDGGRGVRRALMMVAAAAVVAGGVTDAGARTPAAQPARVATTVVAIIESGVNVYHDEFDRPALKAHPSSFLPGYPRNASALSLDLAQRDYLTAVRADDADWRGLKPGALRYVPGTNMVGLIWFPGSPLDKSQNVSVGSESSDPPRPVLDDYQFHGTGVASVLAGKTLGSCPQCLFVLVHADDKEQGFAWAAAQPWIDIISNSWGGPLGVPTRATGGNPQRAAEPSAELTRRAVDAGKIVLFASGNGATGLGAVTPSPAQHDETYTSAYTGPPWILTVGAAKANGQPTNWHDIPVDVIAQGEKRPAAPEESISGKSVFYGTSCATPVAAGAIGHALLQVRRAVRDHGTGARGGSLVKPAAGTRPRNGPLSDGSLTWSEVLDAARAVAAWREFAPGSLADDPLVTPTTPASFAYQGFGRLDTDSVPLLTDVLLGRTPTPERAEMQPWATQHETTRTRLWGPAPA